MLPIEIDADSGESEGIENDSQLARQELYLAPINVKSNVVGQRREPIQIIFNAFNATRTRINRKPLEFGNNKYGRKGTLRCQACRRRKSTCLYESEFSPCEFCRSRNMSTCIKRFGDEIERVALTRRIPTSTDADVSQQEALLFQFAFSERFASGAGSFISKLFIKFSSMLSHPLNNKSLRHAALAWATAFYPREFGSDELLRHSLSAGRALASKNANDIDVFDLYAAFLLTLLSGIHQNGAIFMIHLRGVKAILSTLARDTLAKPPNSLHLAIFLALVRDLILETSRYISLLCCEILELLDIFRATIGPITYDQRIHYFTALLGEDSGTHFVFLQSIWHHTTALRRCFRQTVIQQQGNTAAVRRSVIQDLTADIKADLDSINVKRAVAQLLIDKSSASHTIAQDEFTLPAKFALLLYQFCSYLILLIEGDTVRGALSIVDAETSASAFLPLIGDDWLNRDTLLPTPLCLRKFISLRVLWMAGLSLNPERFPAGTCIWTYHKS